MEYVITPASRGIEPYAWWDGAFTEEQLNHLQNEAKKSGQEARVGIGGEGSINESVRRSELNWIANSPETEGIFNILGNVVSRLNAKCYGFDLVGFGEQLQLTNYDEGKEGMYGWHQDFGGEVSRKLSVVVQLTDPSEYEGGNLELMTGNVIKIKKQRGLIVVFPSWTLHQVTPVVKGSRQSLVSWISGPDFK